jgi:hypothetical protein
MSADAIRHFARCAVAATITPCRCHTPLSLRQISPPFQPLRHWLSLRFHAISPSATLMPIPLFNIITLDAALRRSAAAIPPYAPGARALRREKARNMRNDIYVARAAQASIALPDADDDAAAQARDGGARRDSARHARRARKSASEYMRRGAPLPLPPDFLSPIFLHFSSCQRR